MDQPQQASELEELLAEALAAIRAPKRRLFAEVYPSCSTGREAALKAGYAPKAADQTASALIRNAKVQRAVMIGVKLRSLGNQVDAEYVLRELVALDQVNLLDFLEVSESGKGWRINLAKVSREQAKALSEITVSTDGDVKIKLLSRHKNLELIGKHTKIQAWLDKLDIETSGSIDVVGRLREARQRTQAARKAEKGGE
jgi:phage terminase small subunit